MMSLVEKGLELQACPTYFVIVICIRSTVSAFYKTSMLGYFLKSKMRLEKTKRNFFINGVPTIVIYLSKIQMFPLLTLLVPIFDSSIFIWTFTVYMIGSRLIRCYLKIRKDINKVEVKALKKLAKKRKLSTPQKESLNGIDKIKIKDKRLKKSLKKRNVIRSDDTLSNLVETEISIKDLFTANEEKDEPKLKND
jgi:hypothetical protein